MEIATHTLTVAIAAADGINCEIRVNGGGVGDGKPRLIWPTTDTP